MFIRKPFVALAFFIGIGLLFLFSVSYIWMPLIESSYLLKAIAEVLAIVLCLMAVFFAVFYFIVKKNQHPSEKKRSIISKFPGAISRLPAKDGDSSANAATMTG